MRRTALCLLLLASCQSHHKTVAHGDVVAAVGSASRAVVADLDGDGKREIVVVNEKTLRVIDRSGGELASVPVTGGIHVLVAADIDDDGRVEILAGWGASRDWHDAKARVTLHRLRAGALAEETIVAPQTPRPEVTAIVPLEDRSLLVAYFDSKYSVTSAIAKRGAAGWQLDPLASIRMATSYARGDIDGDGKPELVVGRIYGNDLETDGEAFVLAPDGTRTKLPTTRGLRSLAIIGGDLFVGDGWHQNYVREADGLVTRIHHEPGGFHAELVEDTAGQFSIERIVPATVDDRTILVTLGNRYVRAFRRDGETWSGVTIGRAARDIAVGDIDGKPGDEVLLVGDKAELVDLRSVAWPDPD